jgi:hypothetical protein
VTTPKLYYCSHAPRSALDCLLFSATPSLVYTVVEITSSAVHTCTCRKHRHLKSHCNHTQKSKTLNLRGSQPNTPPHRSLNLAGTSFLLPHAHPWAVKPTSPPSPSMNKSPMPRRSLISALFKCGSVAFPRSVRSVISFFLVRVGMGLRPWEGGFRVRAPPFKPCGKSHLTMTVYHIISL